MWLVLEERRATKQLDRAPKRIQEAYEFWKAVVMNQGPVGLKGLPGFRDHGLQGEWKGARSSSLNDQWRVIYVVQAQRLQVLVLEVNPHDYRKKS